MRALVIAVLAAVLLVGCMSRAPRKDRSDEVSYNRRELDYPRPGILTGPDGVWTVYRNDADRPSPPPVHEAAPPRPKKREILLCGRTEGCEPDASD